MKKLLPFLVLLLWCVPVKATTYFYGPSTVGGGTRADCAHALIWTDATNGMSAATAQATGGNGNVLVMCSGTYPCSAGGATGITINASGSTGFPVTIQGPPSGTATLTCAYWGNFASVIVGGAAINCSGFSHFLIDGLNASNFIVQNSANGSPSLGYANQQSSVGISTSGCPHSEVRNVTVQNIYVHAYGDDGGNGPNDTADIAAGNADFQSVHDAVLNNAEYNLAGGSSGTTMTSETYYNLTIDHGCQFIHHGDGSTTSFSNIAIHDSIFGPHQQDWAGSLANQSCHNNAMFIFASQSGSLINGLSIYNDTITSDMCSNPSATGSNCSAWLQLGGSMAHVNIYNDIIATTTTTQGFQAMVWYAIGNVSTSGGSSTSYSMYNNTIIGQSSAGGPACTCAGILITFASGATSSGTNQSINNTWQGFNSSYVVYQFTGNGTFSSFFGASANIDYNNYFNFNQIGFEATGSLKYNWMAGLSWNLSHAGNSFPSYDAHGNIGNPTLSSSYVPQVGSALLSAGNNVSATGLTGITSDRNGNARTNPWTQGALNSNPPVPNPIVTPAAPALSLAVPMATTPTATGPIDYVWTQTFNFPLQWMNPGLVWQGSVTKAMTFNCSCTPGGGSVKTSCSCTVN